jgi:peptidoglycan/xylan/chitin deacetylase (PgdA/CDA1 family)
MREVFFKILYWSGITHGLRWWNHLGGKFPILVFHRVSPNHDPYWPPMTPQTFEDTIVLLKRHYKILPLERLIRYTPEELGRACFITFDDAFQDTYEWAIPILLRHNVPASFFIPTRCPLENEVIWPLQIRNAFRFTANKSVELAGQSSSRTFELSSEQEKLKAYRYSIDLLSSLEENEFLKAKTNLLDQLGRSQDPSISVMNVDQIKSISPHFGIHSHTHNHYLLTRLEARRIEEEFQDSSRYISEWVQSENVKLLAYPLGAYSTKVVQQAERCFDYAFSTGDCLASSPTIKMNMHAIPRFNMYHESAFEILAFINGFHRLLNSVIPTRRKPR